MQEVYVPSIIYCIPLNCKRTSSRAAQSLRVQKKYEGSFSYLIAYFVTDDMRQNSDFLKELQFLKSLEPHENIIGFIGCCTDRGKCLTLHARGVNHFLHMFWWRHNDMRPQTIKLIQFPVQKYRKNGFGAKSCSKSQMWSEFVANMWKRKTNCS